MLCGQIFIHVKADIDDFSRFLLGNSGGLSSVTCTAELTIENDN